MRNVPGLEAVNHDYNNEVAFFYVYKSLAHPEKDGYVQPVVLEERLLHIAAAKKQYDTKIPWLADSMANDLKHAFGDRNNSEFVIGSDGKIAIARTWSDPETLRKDLEKLVGKSKTVTSVRDLDRKPAARPKSKVARGVVPRVKRPQGASVLVAKPLLDKAKKDGGKTQPLYAKLRAEAGREILQSGGSGKLYLGFHLDPIHTVHWNNLAEPLRWKIEAPKGVTLSKTEGTAPKVEPEADIDPREFLVDLELDGKVPSEPLVLTVNYFACDDEEGWCRAVQQRYEVALKTDRDAGRVSGGGGRQRGGGGRPPGGGRRPDPARILSMLDENEDGKISESEARGPMKDRFSQMDTNSDGYVTKEEIEARFRGR